MLPFPLIVIIPVNAYTFLFSTVENAQRALLLRDYCNIELSPLITAAPPDFRSSVSRFDY